MVSTSENKNNDDPRPFVRDLISEYETKISEVRESIQGEAHYDANRYDDLWILRFLLSHKGKVKSAANAAKKTILFRYDRRLNDLGDIRYSLDNHNLEKAHPIHRQYLQDYCRDPFALMHTLPDMERGAIVQYYIPSKVDMERLVRDMSQDDLTTLYTLLTEATYQILDTITRESGRLTSLLRVVDCTDLKINRKYARMEAKAAAVFEDSYPQLVGSLLVLNPPRAFQHFWNIFKYLLPRRLKEKINFASPLKDAGDKKLFYKYISSENLPKRYGGASDVWPPKMAGSYFEKERALHQDAGRCQGEPQHRFNKNVTGKSSFNLVRSGRNLVEAASSQSRRLSLRNFNMRASFRRGAS